VRKKRLSVVAALGASLAVAGMLVASPSASAATPGCAVSVSQGKYISAYCVSSTAKLGSATYQCNGSVGATGLKTWTIRAGSSSYLIDPGCWFGLARVW
jgi:hypothetical protein